MQEKKTVTVNDKTYSIYHIPPTAALKNYLKLQKYLLGPVGEAINSMAGKSNILEILEREIDLGNALGKLGESINPEEMTTLFKELIELGARNEKDMPINFEIEFMGNIADVFGVVKEVVKHNYPNFFGMLLGLVDFNLKPATTQAK